MWIHTGQYAHTHTQPTTIALEQRYGIIFFGYDYAW